MQEDRWWEHTDIEYIYIRVRTYTYIRVRTYSYMNAYMRGQTETETRTQTQTETGEPETQTQPASQFSHSHTGSFIFSQSVTSHSCTHCMRFAQTSPGFKYRILAGRKKKLVRRSFLDGNTAVMHSMKH